MSERDWFVPVFQSESSYSFQPQVSVGRLRAALKARYLRWAEMLIDTLTVAASLLLANWIYARLGLGVNAHYSQTELGLFGLLLGAFFSFLLERDSGYLSVGSLMRIRETERVLRTCFIVCVLIIFLSYLAHQFMSRWVLFLFAPICLTLIVVQKQVTEAILAGLFRRGLSTTRAVIYGAGETGRQVFSTLLRSPRLGIKPVACFDHNEEMDALPLPQVGYRRGGSTLSIIGRRPTASDLIGLNAQVLISAIPSISQEQSEVLRETVQQSGVSLVSVPLTSSSIPFNSVYADLDGLLLSSHSGTQERPFNWVFKRALDVLVSSTLLLVLSPVFLLLMLLVRLDSEGPIFFTQARLGKHGKPFNIFKFRSMYVTAPQYAASPSASTDWRITRTGRILRRTSLDELPQLLNVLRGDMSLVGPRPEMKYIAEQYSERERIRLSVTPGITGIWQLSADRCFAIHENLEYDLYYIRYRNIFMDLSILIHTLLFAVRGV